MASDTTIPCSDETREKLEGEKREDETWNDCLLRLANLDDNGDSITPEVQHQLDRIEEEVSRIPDRVVSDLRSH